MSESLASPFSIKAKAALTGTILAATGLVASCSGEAEQGTTTQTQTSEITPQLDYTTQLEKQILTPEQQKRLIIAQKTAQDILDVTCGQLGSEFKKGNQELARTSMSLVYAGAKFILRKVEAQPNSSITVTEAVTKSLKNPQPEDCVSASVLKFPTQGAYSDYLSHVKREHYPSD